MKGRNGFYFIVGALVAAVAIGGYFYYQESQKSGIEVEVGNGGISVQTN